MAKRELERAQAYQKRYADKHRRQVDFKEGQRVWLKAINLPSGAVSKASKDRFKGPLIMLRMIGENAALVDLPKSFLVRPVFRVSLLAPVEEEPPRFKKRPVVQEPAEEVRDRRGRSASEE